MEFPKKKKLKEDSIKYESCENGGIFFFINNYLINYNNNLFHKDVCERKKF